MNNGSVLMADDMSLVDQIAARLKEELRDNFQRIDERFEKIDKRFEKQEEFNREVLRELGLLNYKVSLLEVLPDKVDALTLRMDNTEERVGSIEETLEVHTSALVTLHRMIEPMAKAIIRIEGDVVELKGRVSALESKVSTLEFRVDRLDGTNGNGRSGDHQ